MAEQYGPSFDAVRAFAAVARKLSFRGAAAELAIDATVLSRRIARLESRLGVRLLHRTTRKVTLTEAGAMYLRRCEDILARLEDAEAEVSRHASGPTGTLRVALPNVFGQRHIAPLIPEFMSLYPSLRIELTFGDRMADLLDERCDAAVRIGALEGGGDLRVRRLAPIRRFLCASPDYIDRYGEPEQPPDLAGHRILHFSPLQSGEKWRLHGPGGPIELSFSPVLKADNVEVLRLAALAGQGIALLANFVAGEDVAAGRLVPVMKKWSPAQSAVFMVYPNAPFVPQKVRVLSDFLAAKLGARRRASRGEAQHARAVSLAEQTPIATKNAWTL